jgi:hypothetical protein
LRAGAWVGYLTAALGKGIYAEYSANVGCRLRLRVLDLNARCIRYPVDGVESRNNGGCVDQRDIADGCTNPRLRVRQPFIVDTQHSLRECDQ